MPPLALLVLAALASPPSPDPALRHALSLREEQAGIAGVAGTEWTVLPSGAWSVAAFAEGGGRDGLRIVRSGRLTPGRLAALARAVAAERVGTLRPEIGTPAPVNRHRYRLWDGPARVVLDGAPAHLTGTAEANAAAAVVGEGEVEDRDRFARVVGAVERATAGD